jgi:hypothetical protein
MNEQKDGGLSEIVRDFNNFPFNMSRPTSMARGRSARGEIENYCGDGKSGSSWSLIAQC